jgi:hypothetical protein
VASVAWPLVLVTSFVLARNARAAGRGPGLAVFFYWALTVAALASFAKEGAVQNYYVEPWLATVLAAAVVLPMVEGPRAAAVRVGAVLVASTVALYTNNWAHQLPRAIAHPETDVGFRRLWQVVRETDGPILSENLSALVLNRRPVLVEPFGLLTLSRAGLLRTRPIVRDCEAGVFEIVVVEGLLEQVPSIRECLDRDYRLAEELPPYRLLRPSATADRPVAD